MVQPVTDDDEGLKHLYQPTAADGSSDVVIDIVAVHGLGVHPDHTWSKNVGTKDDPRWVNWLQESDMLPAAVPMARIMRYGYKSGWFGRGSIRQTARTVAQKLLLALRRDRKALCEAHHEKAEWPSLFDSVVGLVFFGTPFRGADGMSQSEMLKAAWREYGTEDVEEAPLYILDPGNEVLQDLVDQFCKIWSRSGRGPVACFFELQASEVGAIVGQQRRRTFVVNERSGSLDLSDRVHKYASAKTHFDMNKFGKPTEEEFLVLRDVVEEMAKHAYERRKTVASDEADGRMFIGDRTYTQVSRKRVKHFTGRKSQLSQIGSYFSDTETVQPRTLILQALGGQGKSQIALEYCRRSESQYNGIFWVYANSETTATQSFERLAAELGNFSPGMPGDAEAKIRFVHRYLEQLGGRWMLVFDNYDDPAGFPHVERMIPSRGSGDVLFTSRNKGLDRLGKVIDIPPLTSEEGVALLLRGYQDVKVEDHLLEGSKIVKRLGGLALAIDQAAAYIKYKKLPIERLANFSTLYEAQREKVLSHTPRNFWKYGTMQIHGNDEEDQAINAFTTWEMSFQQFESDDSERKADAAHFLTLSAFFDPSNIGESMFRCHWEIGATPPRWMTMLFAVNEVKSDNKDDDPSDDLRTTDDDTTYLDVGSEAAHGDSAEGGGLRRRSCWDSERFWELIDQAYERSLLESVMSETDDDEANFSLHPLIRDWLQLRQEPAQRESYTEEAIDSVVSCIQMYDNTPVSPATKGLLMLHMDACLSENEQFSKQERQLGQYVQRCGAASWFASFYQNQGRYGTSEQLERLTVETTQRTLGLEHPSTLTSMNNLADVLSHQGKYGQAEEIHQRALKLRETVLGLEHPDTLISMNNLADVLSHQGKYGQAEEIHQRALKLRETVLGLEHPSTLTSMNNLADVLSHQGKYGQAEEIHQRALKLNKTVLGLEHPSTLTSMNNLAATLWNQGRLWEAEKLEIQILHTRNKLLGSEHPSTLSSMANLASTWKSQGRDFNAIELMQQAARIQREKLDLDHPDAVNSAQTLREWLARLEVDEGKSASPTFEKFPHIVTICENCEHFSQVD